MKRRLTCLLLALILLLGMLPSVCAASDEAQTAADALHTLGLFNGTGSNADGTPIYDLDRTPTRHEAVTMLVRLLGKESDAKYGLQRRRERHLCAVHHVRAARTRLYERR